MRFLIVEGTAREGRKSIHAANYLVEKLKERGHQTILFDLKEKEIPPLGNRTYKEDEQPVPDNAEELSDKVKKCDGLFIVTPEYNHSFPGVLKNALDYLYTEYDGKPFGYITVSAGGFGGVRALGHLHDFTIAVGGRIGPHLPVSNVGSVFSNEGELLDTEYDERFDQFVEKMEDYLRSPDKERLK